VAHRGRKSADEALLLALACGATVESAARAAGVSSRTAHRRLADPGFHGRVQQVRSDMVQRTSGTLTAAAAESVRTLLELQKAPTPAAVRLGAARAILEMGMRLRELADVEERLTALEECLAAGRGQ
jgi:hypothetical protein